MTDQEWHDLRENRRKLCKNGDLKCGPDMIPYTISRDGEPWSWYSRQWVEQATNICNKEEFQKSVKPLKRF